MSMWTVAEVAAWVDSFAPFDTAEGFDNVGLLVGDGQATAERVLFCLDVTEAAIAEAMRQQATLIVSHHPVLFSGAKRILYNDPEDRVLCALIRNRLSLIAAHTNLDAAEGGTGDCLAAAIGLTHAAPTSDRYVRVGELPSPMTAEEAALRVGHGLGRLPILYGAGERVISRVAVGAGAYGEGWEAALQAGAQAYVTGEIHHHQALPACASGLTLIEAGHFFTEQPVVAALKQRFLTETLRRGHAAEAFSFDLPPYSVRRMAFA